MSQADVIRTIKIKTNTLKRLQKEFSYYLAEKDKEQSRLDRLRTEGADAHDLKQAENVLAESAMMIPETRQRLEAALSDLEGFVSENDQDAAGSEELEAARAALADAQGIFS
ncbi:Tubulin-specific chaperone A [Monoraphidium neglectum]|uniref:Tubulin-specific chaperone A n=1 Tax=Monoraphidium neglectum TaxID=145388 RepID=A0A0D2MZ95_9CHLO|nr:Tubulin-specific chaperone A [Monoraphidium neglectum]KIZ07725.1 Tubulin-specific chaperone A [Monoraphidium neglectum]|eukprot:XP_013906744.1 Tubulin-specific chaperone A [Monoraphidium neglectum]